jgi:hypothetical protein
LDNGRSDSDYSDSDYSDSDYSDSDYSDSDYSDSDYSDSDYSDSDYSNIIGPNEGGAAGTGETHPGKVNRIETECVQIPCRKGTHGANPGLRQKRGATKSEHRVS